jgi:hypothetical protein
MDFSATARPFEPFASGRHLTGRRGHSRAAVLQGQTTVQFLFRSAAVLFASLVTIEGAQADFDIFRYEIQAADADRFAELFRRTDGQPTAEQIERHYLQGAGRGVEIFTPGRIRNAARMAARVGELNADYRHAIDTCLPLTPKLNQELRAVYLAYRALLPEYPLPQVHLVFGAGNSGGTAAADAQVIGLEVACRSGIGTDEYRRFMRMMFAHETAHSWQPQVDESSVHDLLLFTALREGTPDFLAGLVTGTSPSTERDDFARPRERSLWAQFQRDRQAVIAAGSNDFSRESAAGQAYFRWFANYGTAPVGWPHEVGYWVGMQIAAAYVAQSKDKAQAIRDLLKLKDPQAVLSASGYQERIEAP